ncbi:hypothetical protein ASE08_05180 [Rhizobacter sp. Root16D2]|nr:hypothetical protein ASE08_05180 [Rhizobacter sp. Root16D2]
MKGQTAHSKAHELVEHGIEQRFVTVSDRGILLIPADHFDEKWINALRLGRQQLRGHDAAREQGAQLFAIRAGLDLGIEGEEEGFGKEFVCDAQLEPRAACLDARRHGQDAGRNRAMLTRIHG